jgi:hypothetical protein
VGSPFPLFFNLYFVSPEAQPISINKHPTMTWLSWTSVSPASVVALCLQEWVSWLPLRNITSLSAVATGRHIGVVSASCWGEETGKNRKAA